MDSFKRMQVRSIKKKKSSFQAKFFPEKKA